MSTASAVMITSRKRRSIGVNIGDVVPFPGPGEFVYPTVSLKADPISAGRPP